MVDSKKTEAEEPTNIHQSDSFKEIIKLEMHDKERDYITLCTVAIHASIAYHVLKENQEFASEYDTDEDDQNLQKLLFKAYLITTINPISIEKICDDSVIITFKKVGMALYAFNCLYNNSCAPNSFFFHYGSLIVTRAKASIKKGEQVTICYG